MRKVPSTPVKQNVTKRRHELDWLRTLIVLGLIPIHTATLFSVASYLQLQRQQVTLTMDRVVGFTTAWAMPLLFLVAGASAWFALGSRTPRQFIEERLKRLLLPFAFATLVLIPVQVYAVLVAHPELLTGAHIPLPDSHMLDSYPQFYLVYVLAYGYFMTHFSLDLVPIFWAHLWFLPRLLVVSFVALPLVLALRAPRFHHMLGRLRRLYDRRGGIFLLGVLVGATNAAFYSGWLNTLTAGWPLYDDWDQFLVFLLFFLLGMVIYADARLLRRVEEEGMAALVVGCALWLLAQVIPPPDFHVPVSASFGSVLFLPFRGMIPWLLSIGILRMALHYFRAENRIGTYLNDAAFPVYVLHMPVLIIIGLAVATWPTSIALKFVVIAFGTALVLYVLYDRLIKHVSALRLLFGLKARAAVVPSEFPARNHPA